MENKVLDENIELIKKYDKNLANKILMFNEEKSNVSLSQTQKGEYNITYKGFYLHNKLGAVDEAKNIASGIEEEENSIRVIYGLGLGYLVEEIVNKIKKSKIIIFEPEIEILKFVLSIAKIDALSNKNVILCNDKETLFNYIFNFTNADSKIKLIYTKEYKQIFEKDFEDTLKKIQISQGQHCANKNTLSYGGGLALQNTYANLSKIFNLSHITQYKDIYKDKTALVISAGPSLKDNIEIIKQNQDKFIIFCVNAALKFVMDSGIKPDFIVDIEIFNGDRHYRDLDISDCYLVLESFANEHKYNVKSKQTITYISQNNFINGWIRDCLNIKDNLETMGTVSYAALNSAYIMGFNKIIVIGQDLAFKNGECYAKGSQYEDLECIFDEKQNKYVIKAKNLEAFAERLVGEDHRNKIGAAEWYISVLNSNIFTVKSQDGNYLPTQAGYALFVEWFEKIAKKYKQEKPEIKLINSSTGGAQINGFENIKLEDVVKDIEKAERIELKSLKLDYDKNYCLNKIKEHKDGIEQYRKFASDALLNCQKFIQELNNKKIITQNALKLMKKHNENLDNLLKCNKGQDWSLFMVVYETKILPLIEKDFTKDIKTTKETFEKLLKIYELIDKDTKVYVDKLTDCESVILK